METKTKELQKIKDKIIGSVTVNIEEITPQLAHQYLDKNFDNRKQSAKHVDWLASQMETNAWMLTHQGIAFDEKGHLRDGQHRLQAIINTMTNQYMIVVRGLDTKTFTVMDTGKLRNAADVLFIEGFTEYPRQMAAVSRGLLEWEHGQYRSIGKSTTRITNFMILQYTKKNDDVVDILRKFMSLASTHPGIINGTLATTFARIFSQLTDSDVDTANLFFEKIYTGANLGEHSAELFLRNWLQQEKFQLHKSSRQYKMAVIIKGWNYFRKDTPVLKMWAWKPKDEIFPVPI